MRKLTTSEFIDRARAVHGDKYGYSLCVYQDNKTKVSVHCIQHGIFYITPNNHISGHGCPSCSGKIKNTNGSFIEKARRLHGKDRYNYGSVIYVDNKKKVKIICYKHGEFLQTPNSHLNGQGCKKCGLSSISENKKSNTKDFVTKAKKVHSNKYDYSLVDYLSSQTKVYIICKEHGVFEQTPSDHISGRGCPGCAKSGFDRTKIGFLYVIRSECGRYMKIGITHDPKQRHAKLSRTTPFSFERIELIEGQGEQMAALEKELLAEYQPVVFTGRFEGYSEWRLWDKSVRVKLFLHK